jgi:CcmD family protein
MRFSLRQATETQRHRGMVIRSLALVFVLTAPLAAQQPQPQPQPEQQEEFVPISQLPAQDQLPAAPLLVIAYAFVWLALFAYLVSVARRLSYVQREVERLETDMKRSARS